jgi:hypothetical protein
VGDCTAGYSGEGEQRYTINNLSHSMKSTEKGGTAMAREFKIYINGKWVSALDSQLYDDLNPYIGEVFARVPAGFGGRAGLEESTELRWISMQLTPREYPF